MKLLLAHDLDVLRGGLHNGPGRRVSLWVQGCRLRCTENCLNPQMLSTSGGWSFEVEAVLTAISRTIASSAWHIDGVTLLGGEPTEQAAAAALLFRGVQAMGLSTMLYSGHTLAHLRQQADPDIDGLLTATDLLLDGPYLSHQGDDAEPWRGSANQQLHLLSARHTVAEVARARTTQGRAWSLRISAAGQWQAAGLQDPSLARDVARQLRSIHRFGETSHVERPRQ